MHLDNRSRKLRPQLVIPRGSERGIQGNCKVPNSNIRDTNGHFSPLESLFSDLNRFRISIRIYQSPVNGIRRLSLEVGTLPLARSEVAAAAEYLEFTAEWARRYEGEKSTGTPDNEPTADRIVLYLLLIRSLFL